MRKGASPAPNNQGRAPAKGSGLDRRDQPVPVRASHVAIDQEPKLLRRLRAPEGGVAGAAEGLAGRRVVAAGDDLGQALGAVLSHPRNIGRKRPAPEGFWTAVQLIDHERERPGVPSRRANSLLCDPKTRRPLVAVASLLSSEPIHGSRRGREVPSRPQVRPFRRARRRIGLGRVDRMEFRQLGDSDIEVSEISLGSWLTYGGGVEQEQTEACTRAAFDAGINFFDTSNIYGVGAAETRLGRDPQGLQARGVRPRHQGLLPDGRETAAASPASRSTSRSTPRSSACRPTTSTSTSATAPTPTRRSRRRWRRSPRSARPARRARSASASGPSSRSRPALEVPDAKKFVSSQPQYNMIWRRPRGRADPLLRGARHLADRLVAARAGSAHRQVQPGRAATRGLARGLGGDGRDDGSLPVGRAARGGPATPPDRRGRRGEHGHHGARLGPPPGEPRLGDHRRLPARAGPPERRGVGRQARPEHARRRSTTRSTASPSPGRSWRTSSRKASPTASRHPRGQGGSGISTDASRLPRVVGSAHSTAGCRGAHSGGSPATNQRRDTHA